MISLCACCFAGMCSWMCMHTHAGKHAHVCTQECKGQKLRLVSSSIAIHLGQSTPIWLDWLFIESQGSSYLRLPNARIRTVYTVVSGFSFKNTSADLSTLQAAWQAFYWLWHLCYDFCLCWLILPVPWLWFLPTAIHSVCSWTSHKWNQTIYTFISDFPIHRFLPLIHVAACISRLWLFLSKW